MQRRGFLFMSLATACGLASTAAVSQAEAHVGNGMEPIQPHSGTEHAVMDDAAMDHGEMEAVQYRDPRYVDPRYEDPRYGRSRRRRPRCRIVRSRVVYRDRFGRMRERFVDRELCR
jgi:hypothetical protein